MVPHFWTSAPKGQCPIKCLWGNSSRMSVHSLIHLLPPIMPFGFSHILWHKDCIRHWPFGANSPPSDPQNLLHPGHQGTYDHYGFLLVRYLKATASKGSAGWPWGELRILPLITVNLPCPLVTVSFSLQVILPI
jgi:hypothetical protein